MLNKIIGTVGAKLLSAVFSIAFVILNANYLGAEEVGVISLIVLAITIMLLVNNFIGGAAIIYLVPRIRTINLLVPSYIWSLLTSILFYVVLQIVPLVPEGYDFHVVVLGLIHAISTFHLYVLLGNKRIHAFNVISTLQVLTTVVAAFLLYYFQEASISFFVLSLYIAYLITLISSGLVALRDISFIKPTRVLPTIRSILKYGGYMQAGNIMQLLNYRLNYYLIEVYLGSAALGKFSVGTQLSEGVLLISKSISTVQYSHIANSKNNEEAQHLTLALLKAAFIISFALFLVLVLIPGSIYSYVFGNEFAEVPTILLYLFAGIVALASTLILSHYFSGIGKPYLNTISSAIGFVAIAVSSLLLIPTYQILGAAMATSISYSLSFLFSLAVFVKGPNLKIKALLITRKDIVLVQQQLYKILNKPS